MRKTTKSATSRFISSQRGKPPLKTIHNCFKQIMGSVPSFTEQTKLRDMGVDSLDGKELEYLLEKIHGSPVDLAAGNKSQINCINIELTIGEIIQQISPAQLAPATC